MELADQCVKRSPTRLYFAVFVINLLHVSTGCVTVWTSPTLPKLNGILTPEEQSLVGSIYNLGAAFGPVVIWLTLDNLGRKKTLNILALCYLVSWTILAVSLNPYVMYLGRIIGGIGVGGSFGGCVLFIGEIGDSKRRSSLCSYNMIFASLGFILQYCLGPYISYHLLISVSASATLVFIAFFYLLPESPHFLLARGETAQAIESLSWYRGNATFAEIQPELNEIKVSLNNQSKGTFVAIINNKGSLKALKISLFLLLIQQASGLSAVFTFTQNIFENANITLSPAICSMFIGFATLILALPSPFIVKKLGLKKAIIVSGFSTATFQTILSLYFYIGIKTSSNVIGFIPVVTLISIIFGASCGLNPCPWAFAAEAFPLEVKGLAASICGVSSSLFTFGAVTGFAFLLNHTSPAIVFGTFALILVISSIIAIFIVPNTKGMTLNEVHEYLNSNHSFKEVNITNSF